MRDIWIVMVEQHYAGHTSVLAVCKTKEEAEKIKEKSRLGSDVHIYGADFNEEYPCC